MTGHNCKLLVTNEILKVIFKQCYLKIPYQSLPTEQQQGGKQKSFALEPLDLHFLDTIDRKMFSLLFPEKK